MLDPNVINTVKATIPAVAQLGPELTKAFYIKMLGQYPELKNIFNMSHQESGAQREALFNAIAAYATNIENPMVLQGAIAKIAHKHCSLGVTKEQYDIVGKCLLEAIDDLLHPGDEVLNAWGAAYTFLKDVFIKVEGDLYEANANAEGGWRGTREFKVAKKEKISCDMYSFELVPVDGKSVITHKVGQYLAVYLKDPSWEYQQIRQYTIVNRPNAKSFTLAIKRDNQGIVSQYMHDKVQEGDVLNLSCPFGDFSYTNEEKKNVVLLAAGSGITPTLAILEELAASNFDKEVHFIYSTQSQESEPFKAKVQEYGQKLNHFKQDIFLTKQDTAQDGYIQGRVDLSKVNLPENPIIYMCGPIGFMQAMAKALMDKGIDKSAINYECFGPHKVV